MSFADQLREKKGLVMDEHPSRRKEFWERAIYKAGLMGHKLAIHAFELTDEHLVARLEACDYTMDQLMMLHLSTPESREEAGVRIPSHVWYEDDVYSDYNVAFDPHVVVYIY